jgi:hypothetical protein
MLQGPIANAQRPNADESFSSANHEPHSKNDQQYWVNGLQKKRSALGFKFKRKH